MWWILPYMVWYKGLGHNLPLKSCAQVCATRLVVPCTYCTYSVAHPMMITFQICSIYWQLREILYFTSLPMLHYNVRTTVYQAHYNLYLLFWPEKTILLIIMHGTLFEVERWKIICGTLAGTCQLHEKYSSSSQIAENDFSVYLVSDVMNHCTYILTKCLNIFNIVLPKRYSLTPLDIYNANGENFWFQSCAKFSGQLNEPWSIFHTIWAHEFHCHEGFNNVVCINCFTTS